MKRICLTLLLLSILTLVCYYSCNDRNKSNESSLQIVKVAQFGEVFTYVPLYLADAKGFFEEEGLKIELISTGGDDKTYAAVIGGSATFGIADPVFVAIAKQNGGVEGRVVGAIANGMPFWGITKNTEIPYIKDAKMLKPYSVATFEAPSTAYTVQSEMFAEAGLKTNIKQGIFGGLIPMIEAGHADIALELEPNVSTAVADGAKIVYSLSDKYPEFALTGITTSEKTIVNNPELVQHFINAITKAESYAYKHPDSTAFFMKKRFPDFDEVIIKDAIIRLLSSKTIPENAVISSTAWKEAVELRVRHDELNSSKIADGVLDMTFANKSIK